MIVYRKGSPLCSSFERYTTMFERTTLKIAALALALVGGATLLPFVGVFVVAPLLAFGLGALAGWRAMEAHRGEETSRGALAGLLVGAGALIGSTVALAVLVLVLHGGMLFQPMMGMPGPGMTMMVGAGGVLVGLLAGVLELGFATIGGVAATALYERDHI